MNAHKDDGLGPRRDKFFLYDPNLIEAIVAADGTFECLTAYLILAAFCQNKHEPRGTHSAAGIQAVQQYSGMSRARADAAVQWLAMAIHPDSGHPFITKTNVSGHPRTAPRFRLEGIDQDRLVALPNQLLAKRTSEAGPSSGLLQRVADSAQPVFAGTRYVGASDVRLAALLLLLRLYERLELERYGGAAPALFNFDRVEVADADDMQLVFVRLGCELQSASDRSEHLQRAAHQTLTRTGAVRLQLGICDPDGELAYTLAAFGRPPDWLPQACYRIRSKSVHPEDWGPDGTWVGPGGFTYEAPLLQGQVPVLVPCPTLLALTPSLPAQTQSFRERTFRRINHVLEEV